MRHPLFILAAAIGCGAPDSGDVDGSRDCPDAVESATDAGEDAGDAWKWRHRIGNADYKGVVASRLVRGPSSNIYFVEERRLAVVPDGGFGLEYWLVSLASTGEKRWESRLEGVDAALRVMAPAAGPDDSITVLAAEEQNYVERALVVRFSGDGKLVWRRSHGSPGVGYGGIIERSGDYYFNAGELYALGSDGSVRWSVPRGRTGRLPGESFSHSAPSMGKDGTIFVGGHDGELIALTRDGSRRWTWSSPITDAAMSTPIPDEDGTVYVFQLETLYAVKDGSLRWSIGPPQASFVHPSDVVIDSVGRLRIYTQIEDRAYSRDGAILWSRIPLVPSDVLFKRAPSIDRGQALVMVLAARIVRVSSDGAGDLIGGGGMSSISEPLLGLGVLFAVGSLSEDPERFVFAIDAAVEPLATAPWPSLHHDERNTRNGASDW